MSTGEHKHTSDQSSSALELEGHQMSTPARRRTRHIPVPHILRSFSSTFITVVVAVIVVIIVRAYAIQTHVVNGASMAPTLAGGDRLLVTKLGKTWGDIFGNSFIPARGSIVVFDHPSKGSDRLVKRVIGIPGDTITITNGVITVSNQEHPNGFNPDTEYGDEFAVDTSNNLTITVPEGQLFVAGDNREQGQSNDSRNLLGTVPVENIIGTLLITVL